MKHDRFIEYEILIREALDVVGFVDNVVIFPGNLTENLLYLGSKRCKTCVIEASAHIFLIEKLCRRADMGCGSQYEVIDRIDLSHPESIQMLGHALIDVLSGNR